MSTRTVEHGSSDDDRERLSPTFVDLVKSGFIENQEIVSRQVRTGPDLPGPRSERVVSAEEPRSPEGNVEQFCGSAETPHSANSESSDGEHRSPPITDNFQDNSGPTENEDLIVQDQVSVNWN